VRSSPSKSTDSAFISFVDEACREALGAPLCWLTIPPWLGVMPLTSDLIRSWLNDEHVWEDIESPRAGLIDHHTAGFG